MSTTRDATDGLFVRLSAFGAGIATVLFLFLFAELIRQDAEIIAFFANFRALTFAAVGLVLGTSAGTALREGTSDLKLFYLGSFLTAGILLAYLHTGDVYRNYPFEPPVTSVILAAATAAALLYASPLPAAYEEIGAVADLITDRAAKIYLVGFLLLKYGLSFAVFVVDQTPYEGVQATGLVYFLVVVSFAVAGKLVLDYADQIRAAGGDADPA